MKTRTTESSRRHTGKFVQSRLYQSTTGVIVVASKTSDMLYGTIVGYTNDCPDHMKKTFGLGHNNAGDGWNSTIFSPFIGTISIETEATDY